MSSSEQDDAWAYINHDRGKPHTRRLTTSRSSSTVSTSRFYNQSTTPTTAAAAIKPEWLTTQMIPPRNSSDSEVSNLAPSYMDILSNTLEHDWLDTYDYPHPQQEATAATIRQQEEATSRSTNRRTFHHQNPIADKEPITVRKTKSMRDHTPRTKLRSPPPPPQHPDVFHDQPRLPEKKQSMHFMNKIKRKLSFSKDKKTTVPQPSSNNDRLSLPALTREPRRTVSSSILPQEPPPNLPPPTTTTTTTTTNNNNINNGLSEYQGYSRHSRHRSFTYSPPPPRTSSLNAPDVPAVPPIPAVPKLQQALKSRTNSVVVRKKKSGDSTVSGGSEVSSAGRSSSSSRPTTSDHTRAQPTVDSKLTSPTLTPIEHSIQLTPATSTYAMNLSHDLAEIEKDIKELEIQRDRHSSFINASELKSRKHEPVREQSLLPLSHSASQHTMASTPVSNATTKTIGRKRGKVNSTSLSISPSFLKAHPPLIATYN